MYFYISLAFFKNIACKFNDKKCLIRFLIDRNKDQVINKIVFLVKLKEKKKHYETNFVY